VVDDHPVFRKRIVALLRAEGHEVVDHEGSVVRALEVGAAGYVSKQADPTEFWVRSALCARRPAEGHAGELVGG
jgi:DNA-binding NarL/FixJ family response regulator